MANGGCRKQSCHLCDFGRASYPGEAACFEGTVARGRPNWLGFWSGIVALCHFQHFAPVASWNSRCSCSTSGRPTTCGPWVSRGFICRPGSFPASADERDILGRQEQRPSQPRLATRHLAMWCNGCGSTPAPRSLQHFNHSCRQSGRPGAHLRGWMV